jgi:hypothetical protein
MPINEILAPSYLRIKYENSIAKHNLTLYFSKQSQITGIQSGASVLGKDGTTLLDIGDIVSQVFSRLNYAGASATRVAEIQVWQGVNNAPNTFLGYVQPSPIQTQPLPQVHVASSYLMYVFSALNRQKARITGFEYVSASPQRLAPDEVPIVDDGTLPWLILRSDYPFSTQDGLPLVAFNSYNFGYNRKLAIKYGRDLAP